MDASRLIVFRLGDERFAVDSDAVEEVVEAIAVTPLAGLPAHLAGVVRHRGRWLAAVDPAPLLGVAASGPRSAALIVRQGPRRFALAADAVLYVRDRPADRTAAGAAGRQRDAAGRSPGGAGGGEPPIIDEQGIITLVRPADLFAADPPAGWQEDGMNQGEFSGQSITMVAFRLGADEFGIGVQHVHEVLPYREPTAVPRLPEFIEGVVEIREAVVPVIDLRARLGLPQAQPGLETRLIVGTLDGERVALVVDAVIEVAQVPATHIAEPPAYFRGLAAEFLDGLARIGDRLLLLLRIDRILTAEERLSLLGASDTQETTPAPEAGARAKGAPAGAGSRRKARKARRSD